MQYPNYLNRIGTEAIDNDPERAADDQLACAWDPTDTPHIRVL